MSAPAELRTDRLQRRVKPPVTGVIGQAVNVAISDNHELPGTAQHSLYSTDGFQELKASPRWKDHLFEIDNSVDDDGSSVDAQIRQFTEYVVAKYRRGKTPRSIGQQLAS